MRLNQALTVFTLVVGPMLVGAQDSTAKTAPPPAGANTISTLSGVYSDQQAGRGETIYRTTCMACHDNADHTGAAFRQNWETRTAFDLFETIRTTMPNDDPGKLPRDDYANIVAYLFKMNNMPSGKKPLPSDSTALKQIVITLGDMR